MIIRKATCDDLEDIANLELECFPVNEAATVHDFNFIVQEFSGFFKPGMNCTFSGLVSIFF
uniref:hypothetical protein n=1 Tax=Methanobrevibacter sp. TaxID=66852 RepID=UPI00386EF8DE